MWNRVVGQQRVKNLLRSSIERGRVAHAYLFYGEDGAGMDAMAIEFARVLNCERGELDACGECTTCRQFDKLQHPNLRLVFALPRGKSERDDEPPVNFLSDVEVKKIQNELSLKAQNLYYRLHIPKANEIRINSIRELRREAALSVFAAGWKVFVILDADDMNTEASNALLKTLEEPTPRTVLILTTAKRERLLPTILSRCQPMKFDPLSGDDICDALVTRCSVDRERAQLVATLANGSYARALDLLATDVRKSRDEVVDFVRNLLSNHPSLLFKQIEELTAGTERSVLEQWLSLMLVWFRDAEALRHGRTAGIVNVDQLESLQSFVTKFPLTDHTRVVREVERAIALIGKNVYLPLVFANLAHELKEAIAVGRTHALVETKTS